MISSTLGKAEEEQSASVVRAEIPADEFALGYTFDALPNVSVQCERIVESGNRTVMPLVWVYGADRKPLEEALSRDPSVETASLAVAFDDELLYRIRWADSVRLVFGIITNARTTVLDLHGADGTWTLRLLSHDRESLSQTHRFCDDHSFRLDIRSIREMDDGSAGHFGLTSKQYETLRTACERGYFQVPRETDLSTLAEELGVSHQALSERIRRATTTLIREALLTDAPSTDS